MSGKTVCCLGEKSSSGDTSTCNEKENFQKAISRTQKFVKKKEIGSRVKARQNFDCRCFQYCFSLSPSLSLSLFRKHKMNF